jgi:hypothetical protein
MSLIVLPIVECKIETYEKFQNSQRPCDAGGDRAGG